MTSIDPQTTAKTAIYAGKLSAKLPNVFSKQSFKKILLWEKR